MANSRCPTSRSNPTYTQVHPLDSEALRDEAQSADGLRLINLLVIDEGLLKTLTDQVRKAIAAYDRCLKRGKTRQDRNACDVRAERDVCEALNRIMDRNEDKIPGDFLNGQWKSFRCVRV